MATSGYTDRTTLNALLPNLDIGDVADPALRAAAFQYLYDQSDANWAYLANLVANGTVSPYPAFMSRNAIINGNFDVWQRGTSFTNPASPTFTADRFFTTYGADSGTLPTTLTHSRLTLSSGDLQGSYYGYRLSTNGSGSSFGANAVYGLNHRIEHGVRYLCGDGKKVTVTFYAKSDIAGKRIGIHLVQNYGTGGSPTSFETITGQIFTLTSSWTKYTVTFTTNTLSGKTFGTGNNDYLQIRLSYMWGSTTATTQYGGGTAETFVGSGDIDIAQAQLCAGDVALPFQPRSFADELTMCQRYYEKSYDIGTNPASSASIGAMCSIAVSSTILEGFRFKKVKRISSPTVNVYSPSGTLGKVWGQSDTDISSGTIAMNGGDSGARYIAGSGFTVGNMNTFHYTADAEL